MSKEPSIVELTVDQVRPLRRSVLRAGMAVQDVNWSGDDVPGVFHLGIVDDGQVIAVSTWIPKPAPDGLDAAMPSLHLRGMAAEPAHQGAGLGTILLTSGLAEAKRRGYLSVWGKARDAAINLYVRQGFVVTEPGFVDPITQLPHHLLVRNL